MLPGQGHDEPMMRGPAMRRASGGCGVPVSGDLATRSPFAGTGRAGQCGTRRAYMASALWHGSRRRVPETPLPARKPAFPLRRVRDGPLPGGLITDRKGGAARRMSFGQRGVPSGRGAFHVAKPEDDLGKMIGPIGPMMQGPIGRRYVKQDHDAGVWPDQPQHLPGRLQSRCQAPAGLPRRVRRIRRFDRGSR